MNKFEYTLPSGAKYTMTAPPGATKEQADLIFYSQVASGALVGYSAGQTLTNVTITPLTFELSRQSRGTAGVPGTLSGVYTYRGEIISALYNSTIGGYWNQIDPYNPEPGPGPGPTPYPPGPGPNPDPWWPIPPKPEPYYPPVPPNPDPINPPHPGPGPAPGPTPGPVPPPGPPIPNPIPPIPIVPPYVPPEKTDYDGRQRDTRPWDGAVPLDGRAGAVITDLYTKTESTNQGFDGYLSPTEIEFAASVLAKYPAVLAMANLAGVPIEEPVDQADVILAKGDRISPISVGTLLPFQVQALQSQIINLVNQPADQISQEKGVGKFGLSCYQLEVAGYVKPGTSAKYIDIDPVDFEKIMNSPAIWTGKNGVRSLDSYLAAENLQDSTNNLLLGTGYSGLVASGVIDPPPEREVSYDTSWVYTNTGLQPLGASSIFMRRENGEIGTGTFSLVPTAYYESLDSGVTTEDATTNQDLASYNFNNVRNNVVKSLYQDIGALTTAAGKFGPEPAALWASSGTVDVYNNILRNAIDETNSRNILLNQLGGAASLYNGAISTVNPAVASSEFAASPYNSYNRYGVSQNYNGLSGSSALPESVVQQLITPMTQLSGAMSVYGKSAQYAMNFTDQITPLGDLYSFNSLTDFFSEGGDIVDYMIAGLSGNGSLFNGGTINGLLGQSLNQITGLSGFGSMSSILSLANMFGNLGSLMGALQIFGNLFGGNNAFVSNTELGIGYSDTVDRDTVDMASQKILGDPKIPQPVYSYPGNFWMNIIIDIAKANQSLSDAARQGDAFLSGSGNVFYRG